MPSEDAEDERGTPARRDVLRAGLVATGLALGVGRAGAVPGRGLDGILGESPGAGRGRRRCGPPVDGPRPGPDVLYEEPVTAPQFENGGGWDADPLLVCGANAYVDGEFLYQDYVYDDHGANTSDGPTPPSPAMPTDSTLFSAPTGDVVYPTGEGYHGNAADLLEFRLRPAGDGIRYRATLNTVTDATIPAVAVGIDTGEGGDADWGYGLGELAPVDHVVVLTGDGAELDGSAIEGSVDTRRNQFEATVPLSPGAETWRHYVVTGLWDAEAGAFRQVAMQPDSETPGGSNGQDVPPVFNVGFRRPEQEPFGAFNARTDRAERELGEVRESRGTRGAGGYGSWREHAQAKVLANRDISAFGADVDFGRLREGVTDRQGVPDTGYLNRLYASREEFGPGVDGTFLAGTVQPYAVYVPESYDGSPTKLFLNLHSLGGSHNQFAAYQPNTLRQFGEQRDAIVFTPESRGPDGWYHDAAELDLFEAWADLRTRYVIDEARVSIGGYSMGGFGTYRFGSLYPDLFGKGFAIVGPPDEEPAGGPTDGAAGGPHGAFDTTDNLRHVPLLLWNGSNDQLVPLPGVLNYERDLKEHGYRHELDVFPGYEHFTFALRDEYGPGRDFLDSERLGDPTVERRPARVTYRAVPSTDNADLGLVHDGAYWVADIDVRAGSETGLVDATAHADGYAEPVREDVRGVGTDPSAHTKRGTDWAAPLTRPAGENRLSVTLEGVESAELYVERPGLDPAAPLELEVTSDGPATLTLVGSFGEQELSVDTGTSERTLTLCPGERA